MFYELKSQNLEEPSIVGLDIGSTKVVMVAGKRNKEGQIQIFGFGRAESRGVEKADVINIMNTSNAVKEALEACKQSAGKHADLAIKQVCVGVAGHHVRNNVNEMDIIRSDPKQQITEKELNYFIELQKKIDIPPGQKIIDIIPKRFEIDGKYVTQNIIGCNGHKLKGAFHIVTADIKACDNIETAVKGAGLDIQSWELQPLASSYAIIGKEDLEAGVLVMDIGGGTTDIAVFQHGVLQHTQVIPLGGKLLTKHIAKTFNILESIAEPLKIIHGTSLAECAVPSRHVTIPSYQGLPKKEVSCYTLAQVIQMNMSHILEYVEYYLQQQSINISKDILGGILLTGGGSQLSALKECIGLKMATLSRNGQHTRYLAPGYPLELQKPEYATSIGLLIKGFQDFDRQWSKEESIVISRNQELLNQQDELVAEKKTYPTIPLQERMQEELVSQDNLHQQSYMTPDITDPTMSQSSNIASSSLSDIPLSMPEKKKKVGLFTRIEQGIYDLFGDDEEEPIR